MTNFNLKYLIIAAVLLSILMIGGAYVYSLITKPKPSSTQTTDNMSPTPNPNNAQPTVPAVGIEGKKPERAIPALPAPLAE